MLMCRASAEKYIVVVTGEMLLMRSLMGDLLHTSGSAIESVDFLEGVDQHVSA